MELKENFDLANKKVCVFGLCDDLYTKMVVKYLEEVKLPYDLILVNSSKQKHNIPGIIKNLNIFFNLMYSGNFLALSKLTYYPYLLAWRMIKYKKSEYYKSLVKPFIGIELRKRAKYMVDHVNHVAMYKILEKEKYEIGLFAGVGIVHAEIIGMFSRFCLNAHPAPLPECRGAGAIQFTLHKGLQPAASVHYATGDIDAGSILLVSEIEVFESDSINSLSDRLTIHAAEKLVEVTSLFLSGRKLNELPNSGKLNYWKNCNQDIQRSAEDALCNLKKLKTQSVRRWPN